MLSELEQSGANKDYVKKKIRACITNQDQGFMYMMDENRVFYQNNEIPFDQLQYDRKLSEGGYGIVYRGRWKYTTVAIKEIKKEKEEVEFVPTSEEAKKLYGEAPKKKPSKEKHVYRNASNK